ncbi:MAG TPA: pseudouridine synthase [Petrotogaceae bacterium]|jgi:23S rRNA pseudouridine2605 synthase|nr:pseudouridine synthase [Petrotogaceae bacterium]HNY37504.1 pseudouridine synthase [Petrotogaceae bacterium]HOG34541.1 pseudouridine synthase [Petrotogaceae bacterium]HPX15455.1 pseudouridine synthase [Petrotogaceae bacterium]HQC40460.1 pseudouridine synthase [Petrotogaceae bacterium]
MEKLQAIVQKAGLARRKAISLIQSGGVKVNGKVIIEPWHEVSAEDKVEFGGYIYKVSDIIKADRKVYYLYNKPVDVLSSKSDTYGRKTITDDIKEFVKEDVFNVGRLDYGTSGLIFLTNDGELADLLMHPRYKIEKTYQALIKGNPTGQELSMLENGVEILIEEKPYKTAPAKIEKVLKKGENSEVTVTITEGKKRQVRLMFRAINHNVIKLRRVKFGPWSIEDVPNPGDIKKLNWKEVQKIKEDLKDRIK